MNNKISVLSSLLLSSALISGCQQEVEQPPATGEETAAVTQPKVVDLMPQAAPAAPVASVANGMATGVVAETFDGGGYTYVRVDAGEQQLWAAGPTTAIAVGDTVTFSTMIPMKDFHSKAMNRDFPVLYFVDGFSTLGSAGGSSAPAVAQSNPHAPAAAAADVPVEMIEKVEGGYTIAEALAQKAELAGKPIKVRGKVTKYTPGIMGKTWIHIVDGSGSEDLIVTTKDSTAMGAVIVAEGALSLDRDFGMGYFYKVLMEDAKLTTE